MLLSSSSVDQRIPEALTIDTANAKGRGVAKSFVRKIEFLK